MLRILLIFLPVLVGSGCGVYAVTSGQVAIREDRNALRFSERDRVIIEEYFRAHPEKKTPLAQAKREKLSAGLARHDNLPPGIQGRPLSRDLESRLTVLPAVYVRIHIGHDVVLVQRDNRLVLDILRAVAD